MLNSDQTKGPMESYNISDFFLNWTEKTCTKTEFLHYCYALEIFYENERFMQPKMLNIFFFFLMGILGLIGLKINT